MWTEGYFNRFQRLRFRMLKLKRGSGIQMKVGGRKIKITQNIGKLQEKLQGLTIDTDYKSNPEFLFFRFKPYTSKLASTPTFCLSP